MNKDQITKEQETPIRTAVQGVFIQCLAWYCDEGKYQPTQEEAFNKSVDIITRIADAKYKEGYEKGLEEGKKEQTMSDEIRNAKTH